MCFAPTPKMPPIPPTPAGPPPRSEESATRVRASDPLFARLGRAGTSGFSQRSSLRIPLNTGFGNTLNA
jgi:hypothetical protein